MLRTPPSPDRVTPPDDPALVARVHDGDAEALATLFRRHAAWLHRVVRRVVDSDDEADDVVQELFVGLPEALAHYVERGALAAWLARVALRIALARRRRDRRREERAPRDADAHLFHATTCPTDDTLLDRVSVEAAVARLPEPLSHVVLIVGTGAITIGQPPSRAAPRSPTRSAAPLRSATRSPTFPPSTPGSLGGPRSATGSAAGRSSGRACAASLS